MLKTRTKLRAILAVAVLAGALSYWGGWPEFRDGDDWDSPYPATRADDERDVTLTLTWQPAADKTPGYINARGHLKGQFKTDAPYSPSPFVETGVAHVGDTVDIHGDAVNGPFLSFDCSITSSGGPVQVKKTIWVGLRAYCSAVIVA